MYKFISLLLAIFPYFLSAQSYDKMNVDIISHWDGATTASVGWVGNRYSGCMGYENSGRQYAIVGNADGTYIVDITVAGDPTTIDFVAGALDSCTWREYQVYDHYAYAVSDDGGPNKFQIIDLQYLPDSAHLVHNSNSIFQRSHTIFVNNGLLYCGSVTTTTGFYTMAVYDIASSHENPILMRVLSDDGITVGHVHDMFVHNDTIYASCGYDGLRVIYYDKTMNTFTLLGSLTSYPDMGYNHSSCLMDDGKTLIMCDEVPESLDVKSINVSDLSDIQTNTTFRSDYDATPHNPYNTHINNRTIIAYYQDGLHVFDMTNPSMPILAGYFDTHHQSVGTAHETASAYRGNWGAYIFPSNRHIIANDMQNGLYVLNADTALGIIGTGIYESDTTQFNIVANPNPSHGKYDIGIESNQSGMAQIMLTNILGAEIYRENIAIQKGVNRHHLDISKYPDGIYMMRIEMDSYKTSRKLIKQ